MSSVEQNIIQNKELLELIKNKRNIKLIIKHADKNLLRAICDIVYNILLGNCEMTKKEYNKLKRYKLHLRRLIRKSSVEKKKKKLHNLIEILPLIIKISEQ